MHRVTQGRSTSGIWTSTGEMQLDLELISPSLFHRHHLGKVRSLCIFLPCCPYPSFSLLLLLTFLLGICMERVEKQRDEDSLKHPKSRNPPQKCSPRHTNYKARKNELKKLHFFQKEPCCLKPGMEGLHGNELREDSKTGVSS